MNILPAFNLLRYIHTVWREQHASPEVIAQLQQDRLRTLVRHVLQHSKFYRELYTAHGIAEHNVDKIRLSDLPIIDKGMIMQHYDGVVCDPALHQRELETFIADKANLTRTYRDTYRVIHTSGSSGTVGLFVYGEDDWTWVKALGVARVTKGPASLVRKTRLAFIGATDGHYAGVTLVREAPRFMFDVLPLSINSPLQESVSAVNEFDPDILTGYASGVYLLAKEQLRGAVKIRPKRIVTSADLLSADMRATITEAFGVAPINFYAASESLCIGAECDAAHSLHLFTDRHVVEVIDRDGVAVPNGIPGTVVLTNLYNFTEPLIRYRMNDEITLGTEVCTCGSPFPVVRSMAGRTEDFLWFTKSDGVREYVHPIVLVEFFVPQLTRFQFVQEGLNSLTVRAVVAPDGDRQKVEQAILHRLHEILREKQLDAQVICRVEHVPDIPNDPRTGKFKLVVPYRT